MTAPTTNRYVDLLTLPMSVTERTAIEALVEHGSQHNAAMALGWKRTKLQSRLRSVQARAARAAGPDTSTPVVKGRIAVSRHQVPEVRPGAVVARYILTAAQNNTYVHEVFLANLEAYAEVLGARIMVSRFTYDVSSHGKKSVKAGRAPGADAYADLWYDPRIAPYVCDDPARHGSCRWELAPDLLWCAEMNILPTAARPLSGLDSYAGSASGVFPHAKIALESVPVVGDRPPKINYTTGAVTQRNYIAKKEGLKGEFHHQFGALLVEVDLTTGDWWARQLNATDDGAFYDLTHRIADGQVTSAHRLLAINWGDVHASKTDPAVAELNWAPAGVLDILQPEYQFWHDTFDMGSRGHHEIKSFGARYAKWVLGGAADSVQREFEGTAQLLQRASRPWCRTVVVSSNHDRHVERWLEEADYRQDPTNAELFLAAQLARVTHLKANPTAGWNELEWALRHVAPDAVRDVEFLARDQSFRIGPPGHQIECGSHGDEGPNGARGNPGNLSKLDVRMNVGHMHSACLRNGLAVAGVCARRLPYAHGPSSWSISHIFTYTNGKRAIATERAGKLWL